MNINQLEQRLQSSLVSNKLQEEILTEFSKLKEAYERMRQEHMAYAEQSDREIANLNNALEDAQQYNFDRS